MADNNKYRLTAGQWATTASGCGCGGGSKVTAVAANVNNDLILIWAQSNPQIVSGALHTYGMQPHVAILDLDPADYATFINDLRFRKPTPAELPTVFGMKLRNG